MASRKAGSPSGSPYASAIGPARFRARSWARSQALSGNRFSAGIPGVSGRVRSPASRVGVMVDTRRDWRVLSERDGWTNRVAAPASAATRVPWRSARA